MSEIQERIESLLRNTEREGIENLIEYLKKEEFFTSPGSTKYHGCYNGGLAKHSLNVFERVRQANEDFKLDIDYHSIVITCLLHDVCKVGAYLGTEKPYRWNRQQPCGHAKLSIDRIKQFIQLTELEEMMIKYHMGIYGLREFDEDKGEYGLRDKDMANAWFHHPIVKVIYFCDEFATLQEKAEESGEQP